MSPQGVTAYSQINATVRALYSRMLSPKTWSTLVQAPDFDAVLNLLSKTVYGPYLEVEGDVLTPRRAVYQLRWHLADVFTKVIRLTPDPGRQLVLQLWRLYEVDNLKATLRGIEAGATWDQVRHLLSPMPKYSVLTAQDMERMIESGEIARAIERIRHTPYYNTLVHALERYRAEGNLFPLEVALDLDYRRGTWHSIEQFRGLDYEQALHILGASLDVDNLLWAIRYRVYHHLSEEEIINYTLPFGYQVSDEDIRAIARGADIAPVVRHIYPDLKGFDRVAVEAHEGLAALEAALYRRIVGICHMAFRGYPFHIGTPTACLLLNEYEIRDLTILIEAKDSHLPMREFASLLEIQPLPSPAD